ncbi:MAG: DUF4340 domain-containing protein [Nitrospinae bacterium]|nr:DUF4340 domain-containing protein [Nitrospinota bacterium]
MASSWKKSAALLLVLIVGGIYAYKAEYLAAKKKEEAERGEKKLFSFDEKSVTGLSVTSEDGKIEVVRDKDAWRITSPISADGDPAAIGGVITAALDASYTESVDGNPRDFGLEPAWTRIDFHLGEKSVALLVGSTSPTGASAYVKTDGKILLVPVSLARGVRKNLFQLREKRFFAGTTSEISKFEIWRGKTQISVEKDAGGRWGVTNPAKSEADDGAVHDLLSALVHTRAVAFADDKSDAETGLKNPAAKVSIWNKSAAQTLLLGDETNDKLGTYARLEGGKTTAVIPANFVRGLPQTARELEPKKNDAEQKDHK